MNEQLSGDPDFGRRVREARKTLGMTQLELAQEVADTTQEWASRVESGTRGVSFHLIPRLAEVLHVTPDYLFGFEGPRVLSPFVVEMQRLEPRDDDDRLQLLEHARILARMDQQRRKRA